VDDAHLLPVGHVVLDPDRRAGRHVQQARHQRLVEGGLGLLRAVPPFLGVLVYLGVNGNGMAERRVKDVRQNQAQTDDYIRSVAGSGGAAAEIDRANALLQSGAINQAEFGALKAKALA